MEKEIGFDIKVVKGSVKSAAVNPAQDAETLHAQLLAVRSLSEHLVVVFDEFQRLRHCPGDPLAIIRSALMSSGANHVSLLFTGSIRNALKMMLEDSHQPIFGWPIAVAITSPVDRSRRATDSPVTRAYARRSYDSRAADWSISGMAAGTSSIRYLESG